MTTTLQRSGAGTLCFTLFSVRIKKMIPLRWSGAERESKKYPLERGGAERVTAATPLP